MAVRVIGSVVGLGVVAAGAVLAARRYAASQAGGGAGDERALPMQELPDASAGGGAAATAAAAAAATAAAAAGTCAAAVAEAPSAPDADAAAALSAALKGNEALLSPEERTLVAALLAEGQAHLFAAWPAPGTQDADKRRLLRQLAALDASYHGGLAAYARGARKLLADAAAGKNPYEGLTPAVPAGERLDFGAPRFLGLEAAGAAAAARAAFVLVAGGLGERLGYSGIKLALPAETATGRCFLQLYVECVLALQAKSRAPRPLPIAIMTSDDTHERTRELLDAHNQFGAAPGQITLMKQEKVACLSDSEARLALDPKDPYAIQTKPHGHGDVHALLHATGLAAQWEKAGFEWVCFFQDTNALVFRALPAALGLSVESNFDMNSLAVPRKAKEAIGAIARLEPINGGTDGGAGAPTAPLTINVEYNQLDPLLRATVAPGGDEDDPATGFSPYPGNINQLVLRLAPYVKVLERTGGVISEFINPKYADASRTAFKSSARLECMMQDIPKAFAPGARVGFTVVNQVWATYSPVKNSAADARAKAAAHAPTHGAAAAEMDFYKCGAEVLALMAGADVGAPLPAEYGGVPVEEWPRVVLSPSFAPTLADVKAKVAAGRVKLAPRSVLILDGEGISIAGDLSVKGALVVRAAPGARVVIDGLKVDNAGWEWAPVDGLPDATEEELMRGFRVVRREALELNFDAPGDYKVPTEAAAAAGASAAASAPPRGAAVAAVAAAVSEAAAAGAVPALGGSGGGSGGDNSEARRAAHELAEAVFASVAGGKQ